MSLLTSFLGARLQLKSASYITILLGAGGAIFIPHSLKPLKTWTWFA